MGRKHSGKRGNGGGKTPDVLDDLAQLKDLELEGTTEAIIERRQLTVRFLEEIEKEIREALRMLRRLGEPWSHGEETSYEFMRLAIDKALTARKKERRERLLQNWKDLLELQKRRIELLRELRALGE